jgi:phosphopantothenoylcysteine decarboxylase
MTKQAAEWVHPELFEALSGQPVFAPGWSYGESMPHIAVRKKADLMAVVPSSANVIARAAGGFADDPVTSTLLSFSGPKLIAPAMNPGMFLNPATQRNLKTLKSDGFVIIEPEEGTVVCGETGPGKLASLEAILESIESNL